jgi:hypothetical protein
MTYVNNGAPIFTGAWSLTTVAAAGGSHDLAYYWKGFHSFYLSTAGLEVFVSRGGIDVFTASLVAAGPQTCPPCLPPSAGFTYTGTTSVTVLAGDIYGFRLTGSHFDGSYILQGVFSVAVDHVITLNEASPATIAPGQMVVLRGSDMPPTAATGVLFKQGAGPDLPASYVFYAQPDVVIARSPGGLTPGPATVRATGAGGTTTTIPLTIQAAPAPPRIFGLRATCSASSDLASISPGVAIKILADGVDTAGTTIIWRRQIDSFTIQVPATSTTAGPQSICTETVAPAGLTSGGWDINITTTVGGSTSAQSNGVGIIVP